MLDDKSERFHNQTTQKHPNLRVDFRNLPDDENGFLKWLDFEKRHRQGYSYSLNLPDDISGMIKGRIAWDSVRAREWLNNNSSLVEEIVSIGLCPSESSRGCDDPFRVINSNLMNECAGILTLQSRLLIETKDGDSARKTLRAIMGLADHIDRTETPTLLDHSTADLTRMQTNMYFLNEIMPNESIRKTEIESYKSILCPLVSFDSMADILKGDCYVSLGAYSNGLKGETFISNEDQDLLLDMISEITGKSIEKIRKGEMGNFAENNEDSEDRIKALPPSCQEIASMETSKIPTWVQDQLSAAMRREQIAASISWYAEQELPVESSTGKKFIFNSADNTISPPEDPKLRSLKWAPISVKQK